ncbi:MAG: UPF0149 family protein [Pseudomonadota bacterium]
MTLLTYKELDRALMDAGSPGSASEAHGTLCGLLAMGANNKTDPWIDHILAETDRHNAFARDARQVLERLRDQVAVTLGDDDNVFPVMLPADEEPLDERAGMLGQWCQGFLYGLATGGLTDPKTASDDVAEAVSDLSEISKAGFAEDDDLEESEAAYAEIVEFVKVAASLIFETLNPVPKGAAPAPSQLH